MNTIDHNSNLISKKKIAGSYLLAILSFVILVVIDQLSKYFITTSMELHDAIPLIEGILEIHYIHNPGAAWGLFENQHLLFGICAIIACIFGAIFYVKCTQANTLKALRICIVMILSGAIGNFIDRVRFQYVIDFIYFKLIDFPVFNIADCYVTIGFIITVILIFFVYKENELEVLSFEKKPE